MEYFKKFSQDDLCKFIEGTQIELFICMPSIHGEVMESIDYLNHYEGSNVAINIGVDFSSETFRQGYGDIECFEEITLCDYKVYNIVDNRISFIISDEIGYFLFVESRSMIAPDKELLNAIRIDPATIVRLKQFYFKSFKQHEFENKLTDAIIDESKNISEIRDELRKGALLSSDELTFEQIEKVEKDLKDNPPLSPDYKRIVNFYSNKLQYAELHYEGQKYDSQSVKIPSSLLPYNNEEVRNRLTTRLKMFENLHKTDEYKDFKEIEHEKKRIVEKYLTPIKVRRGKSVLIISDKNNFIKEVLELEKALKEKSKKLYQVLFNEIENSKSNIKETLIEFLIANPTEDMIIMKPENYSVMATNISNGLINNLKFPDPFKVINKFKLEMNFSDITFEDLKDKELLSELKEKKIIDEADENYLADFGKGIGINR